MSRTVWVIDPSLSTRTIMRICLRRVEISCMLFESGEQMLRGWRDVCRAVPELVFLEWSLSAPDAGRSQHLDALDVVRLLRTHALFKETAILLLSACGRFEQVRARRAGVNGHIPKPFNRRTVLNAVNQFIPVDTYEYYLRGATHESEYVPQPALARNAHPGRGG